MTCSFKGFISFTLSLQWMCYIWHRLLWITFIVIWNLFVVEKLFFIWDILQCSLLKVTRCFGVTCLHFQEHRICQVRNQHESRWQAVYSEVAWIVTQTLYCVLQMNGCWKRKLNKCIDTEHQKIINQEISHWMGVLKCLMAFSDKFLSSKMKIFWGQCSCLSCMMKC